jgi:hypothetical protein
MESFCTKFTWGCKQKAWRDKLVQDLTNNLAHMLFMLQPYVALLRATTVQCISKIDAMHML